MDRDGFYELEYDKQLGIDVSLNESWSETERKVRDFIKTDLNMPEMENAEIEQAHRMMSRDPNKCTIIEPGHVYYWTSS